MAAVRPLPCPEREQGGDRNVVEARLLAPRPSLHGREAHEGE